MKIGPDLVDTVTVEDPFLNEPTKPKRNRDGDGQAGGGARARWGIASQPSPYIFLPPFSHSANSIPAPSIRPRCRPGLGLSQPISTPHVLSQEFQKPARPHLPHRVCTPGACFGVSRPQERRALPGRPQGGIRSILRKTAARNKQWGIETAGNAGVRRRRK